MVLAAVLAIRRVLRVPAATSVELTPVAFSDFLRDVKANRVKSVVADGDAVAFELRDGARLETTAPPGFIALNPTFLSGLLERGVQFSATACGSRAAAKLSDAGHRTVRLRASRAWCCFASPAASPTLEKVRTVDPNNVTVTFNDVAGVDEAKDEVREIVDFLKEPGRFSSIGGRIPRGILLVGPSGHRQDAAGAVDGR